MELSLNKKKDVIMENHVLMGRYSGDYKKPPKHASFNLYPPSIKGRKITHILLVDTTKRKHQHLVLSAEKFLAEHGDDERVSLAFNKAAAFAATDLSVDELDACQKLAIFNNLDDMRAAVENGTWATAGHVPAPAPEPAGRAPSEGGTVATAVEGVPSERMARSVARSRPLREKKIAECRMTNGGVLVCELCKEKGEKYPAKHRDSECVFEVHHIKPVSEGEMENSTKDLAVLCANCHRAVHASADAEKNFHELKAHFESQE